MAIFKVNGQSVQPEKNQKLLRFLRDELHLTSVKDGCSEGACGACTVIIDGKTCKACVPDTDSLDGREIITVEGLTEWEQQVYTYTYLAPSKSGLEYTLSSSTRYWGQVSAKTVCPFSLARRISS